MRILAFSDLHCDHATAEKIVTAATDADVVLGIGDFAQQHEGLTKTMDWLAPIAEKAIYVSGNHEMLEALQQATNATVLHGQSVTRDGLVIAGIGAAIPPSAPLPWGSYDLTEAEAGTLLDSILACDILISHSPPKGHCDINAKEGSIGSVAILNAVKRLAPKYLLCGHIHDAWGQRSMVGKTQIMNLGPDPIFLEIADAD